MAALDLTPKGIRKREVDPTPEEVLKELTQRIEKRIARNANNATLDEVFQLYQLFTDNLPKIVTLENVAHPVKRDAILKIVDTFEQLEANLPIMAEFLTRKNQAN